MVGRALVSDWTGQPLNKARQALLRAGGPLFGTDMSASVPESSGLGRESDTPAFHDTYPETVAEAIHGPVRASYGLIN